MMRQVQQLCSDATWAYEQALQQGQGAVTLAMSTHADTVAVSTSRSLLHLLSCAANLSVLVHSA